MFIPTVLVVLTVTVAVLAVQNAHEVPVSLLFWHFEVPMALMLLGAMAVGADRLRPRTLR